MRFHKLLLIIALFIGSNSLQGDVNEQSLLKEVKALIEKQDEINEQMDKIKALLGLHVALEGLDLLDISDEEDGQVKTLTAKAIPLFKDEKFSEAKDLLQDAWEKDPNSKVASYNLGISYARMNRPILAKQFLKQAMDANLKVDEKDRVLSYLRGESDTISTVEEEKDSKLQTELTNLQKETDSLIRSSHLSGPKKVKTVIASLEKIEAKMESSDEEFEKYYTYISDAYSAFEMYPEALGALVNYEKAMKGKVLPDDFFTKKLDLESKSAEHEKKMEALWDTDLSEDIRYKLANDIHELKVFASQLDEFVVEPSSEDSDFSMICERLGEYPWGRKLNRHVLILSRFQEIYYSSLDGTFPIDRYHDVNGNQFLKNIVQTPPEEMPLKEVKMVSVDLNINGKIVPYIIIYTYVPKLDSFVLVRINQDDLAV